MCMSQSYTAYVYVIWCENPDIEEFYVGCTTNIASRWANHKQSAKTSNRPLYLRMRTGGGAENWNITVVENVECFRRSDLFRAEARWIADLKPPLNAHRYKRLPLGLSKKMMRDFADARMESYYRFVARPETRKIP